jgi:hypothetical protein
MLSSASATEKLKGKKCSKCKKEILEVRIFNKSTGIGATLVHSQTIENTFFGKVNIIKEHCTVDEEELSKLLKRRN